MAASEVLSFIPWSWSVTSPRLSPPMLRETRELVGGGGNTLVREEAEDILACGMWCRGRYDLIITL